MTLLLPTLAEKLGYPGLIHDGNIHVAQAVLVFIILLIFSLIFKGVYINVYNRVVPPKKPSLTGLIEVLAEAIYKISEDIIGPQAKRYFPLIASLFFYILFCNLMGLIPGFTPPTENINTNLACAIVVFIYYNYSGIKQHGLWNYIKGFAGPMIWIAPLMFSVEVISHIVRPLSLSVRLFGNIAGDHLMIEMFSGLAPWIVPIPFICLALFVAVIQAFVFTLLSIIYISLAVREHPLTKEDA